MASTINASTSAGLVNTADTSGVLQLQTANTAALTIDASQIVTLSSASNPSLIVNRTASTGDAGLSFQSTGTGVASLTGLYGGGLRFGTGSGDTERMRIDSSGNVGIGTASLNSSNSSRSLSLNGATDVAYELKSGGTFSGVLYHDGTTLTAKNVVNGAFAFGTNNTERMRIDSSGTVGIGQTPSQAMLAIKANTSSIYQIYLQQSNTDDGWTFFADNADGFLKFYRRASGTNTLRVQFNSTGSVTNSTGTYGTISDVRLKENVVDATPKLNEVMQLKVRNYNLIGDDLKQIGFVAQEIEEVFPALTETGGTDGIKSVKTSILIPILVKAIQELKAINDTQAETLSQQATLINALTARIEALENK